MGSKCTHSEGLALWRVEGDSMVAVSLFQLFLTGHKLMEIGIIFLCILLSPQGLVLCVEHKRCS